MKQKLNSQPRTLEGTLFEVAFLVAALLAWGFIAWLFARAPETIPIHFGPSGQPDAWGNRLNALFPCILFTVIGACMLAGAYFPVSINLPFNVQTPRQTVLAVRMLRSLALAMLLLMVLIAVAMLRPAASSGTLIFVGVGVVVAVAIGFTVFIWRAK